jgi:glycosyltransferase involved in cell wall biosynthesis
MSETTPYVIFTGTDPASKKGGIGVVLPGYFMALDAVGIEHCTIPTYHPAQAGGKWLMWLKALPVIFWKSRDLRSHGRQPVVYSHAGAGVSFLRESLVLWAARMAGSRTMLHVHACAVDDYLNNPFKRQLLKMAVIPADTVCVLTQWWRERLQQCGVGKCVRVIPNPLPQDLLTAAHATRNRTDSNIVRVLSMARLVAGKGVDIIVRAMAELPENVHLTIAGDGDQRVELQQLVDYLGLNKRVQFAGWVSGYEKQKLLDDADIFCLPSTYDAFPMSMAEAMANGVPVVAVRWGGIPDMMAHEVAGILVDQAQPEAIANAIGKLLDDTVRLRMGVDAKRWILGISEPEQVGKQLMDVVDELGS